MKRNNYVDKKEFLEQLKILNNNETDEVPEKLHLIFHKMATNYATIASFRNYSYIEDMITEAYINCVLVARKFDIERFNPFAYFTTVIHRNFLNFIAKEKKQQSKKWIELKKVMELYKIENNIDLPLPDGIIKKMHEIDRKKT